MPVKRSLAPPDEPAPFEAMKISELASRSRVPLPTIKFYIREGLLAPGKRTARNQALYGAEHLERLLLVRALKDDAGLSISSISRALRAADAAREEFVLAAIDAIAERRGPGLEAGSGEFKKARDTVMDLSRRAGWAIEPSDQSVKDASSALAIARRSYPLEDPASLEPYVEIAERIARHEIPDDWKPDRTPMAALRYAVLGTVLFEPFILALRRMAHVSRARRMEKKHTKARRAR